VGALSQVNEVLAGDQLAAELARAVPGGESAALLDGLGGGGLSDAGRIDALVAVHRHLGWLQALELALLADLDDHPLVSIPGHPDALNDFRATREQVAAALHFSPDTAGGRLADAQRLVATFPATVAALGEGRIHFMQAKVLSDLTKPLSHAGERAGELQRAVEERVLPRMPEQAVSATRKAIQRAVIKADPAGAERRHQQAKAERCTFTVPEPDGMAMFGARLAAQDAARVEAVLDDHARSAADDDPRTLAARRADALVELVTGVQAEAVQISGTDAASASQAEGVQKFGTGVASRGRVGVAVQVTVPWDVLLGTSEAPADLAGYGPITASQARDLAVSTDATWRRLLTEPATGTVIKTDPTTYRPTAELERHLIARDPHCRFPGCTRRSSSSRSDLHHVRRFADGGPTDETNMIPLCRRHHLTTHRAGWHLTYDPRKGTTTWTAPTAHTYTTHPEPVGRVGQPS